MTSAPFDKSAGRASRLPWLLAAADALFAVAYLASRWWLEPSGYLARNLDLNAEQSLTTWYASSKLLLASWIAFEAASTSGEGEVCGRSWSLLALPALLLALSVDEAIGVHERAGVLMDWLVVDRRDTLFFRTNYWMFPCAALLVAASVPIVRSLAARSPQVARLVWVGVALLIAGGGVVEALQNFLERDTPLHWLQIAVEETLENAAGTVLMAAALKLSRAKT